MPVASTFALLDITRGRKRLARQLPGTRVPVTITGFITSQWGEDDGTSIEFQVEVTDLKLDPPIFDNKQAMTEGWFISQTQGTDDLGDFRLEKVDGLCTLVSDHQAWIHVIAQAKSGSTYHRNALRFIKRHNPTEWDYIRQYMK